MAARRGRPAGARGVSGAGGLATGAARRVGGREHGARSRAARRRFGRAASARAPYAASPDQTFRSARPADGGRRRIDLALALGDRFHARSRVASSPAVQRAPARSALYVSCGDVESVAVSGRDRRDAGRRRAAPAAGDDCAVGIGPRATLHEIGDGDVSGVVGGIDDGLGGATVRGSARNRLEAPPTLRAHGYRERVDALRSGERARRVTASASPRGARTREGVLLQRERPARLPVDGVDPVNPRSPPAPPPRRPPPFPPRATPRTATAPPPVEMPRTAPREAVPPGPSLLECPPIASAVTPTTPLPVPSAEARAAPADPKLWGTVAAAERSSLPVPGWTTVSSEVASPARPGRPPPEAPPPLPARATWTRMSSPAAALPLTASTRVTLPPSPPAAPSSPCAPLPP